MFVFSSKYFLLALLFFVIEVLIALFVRDSFVRPFGGDYLAVILVYCAVRTVLKAPVVKVAIGVLAFAYLIEASQHFHVLDTLRLNHNTVARTVLGYGFDWWDMAAYTLGVLTVVAVDRDGRR